jgi:hypothetical protein
MLFSLALAGFPDSVAKGGRLGGFDFPARPCYNVVNVKRET